MNNDMVRDLSYIDNVNISANIAKKRGCSNICEQPL